MTSVAVAAVLYVLVLMSAEAGKLDEPEWKAIVYTGSKIWAGTDSLVYVQVHGALGDSRLVQLTPTRPQMEARSVDTFPLPDLDAKHIGTIRSITVSKQHSYAFFNDWELLKVELVDPNEKVYLFNCKCWLTTLKNKQTLNLFAVNGIEVNKKGDAVDRLAEMNRKTFRMFPVLVSLLFLMLVLIIFTYFGNMICKKWRLQYFNDSKYFIYLKCLLNYKVTLNSFSISLEYIWVTLWLLKLTVTKRLREFKIFLQETVFNWDQCWSLKTIFP